ncbi:MAG: adenylyl-sulfate kinase [Bacteroidales bacterium]|nr:adenylyl-sulfate kinase [Bacteroidales bacterium]
MRPEPKYDINSNPLSVWFIGLPCSGKSTVSQGVYAKLKSDGFKIKLLDGDDLRKGINNNLGFSITDRQENIRRVAEVNKLFLDEEYIVLNALICPLRDMRLMVSNIIGVENFCEIFTDAPLHICEGRDVKGMYLKARTGQIRNFTGIDSPFELPAHPDVIIRTDQLSIEASVQNVYDFLKSKLQRNK